MLDDGAVNGALGRAARSEPLWNRRFTVAPANSDAHRPLGPEQNLAASLSHCETRVVTNDYTIRFQGQAYQIARASPTSRPAGRRRATRLPSRASSYKLYDIDNDARPR